MEHQRQSITASDTSENGLTEASVTTIPRSKFHEAGTWCAQRVAVGLQAVARRGLGDGFSILTYHRVTDRPAAGESPTVNVTPNRLRSQLEGLLSRGFEAWSLRKAIAAWQNSELIPGNVFVVTFDDGYENNLLHAVPILNELRVPATIFLATAYLDSSRPFPFDNWSCAGSAKVPDTSWRPLTTTQCHTLMENELIELAAHTHTHDAFAGRTAEFRVDMELSLEILDKRFGIRSPTFSFPFGLTTPELIAAARDLGVACALSTRAERVGAALDPFHWGRFTASDLDTAATLSAKLQGWYTPVSDLLRVMKQPLAALGSRGKGDLVTMSKPCFAGK
jgi:peptidoglycan/xylan/chitin deacetylase (PgdA/CDA1 family)